MLIRLSEIIHICAHSRISFPDIIRDPDMSNTDYFATALHRR